MDGLEESARLFKTLMHPARLEILETLRDSEHCVCHMEAALGDRQAAQKYSLAANSIKSQINLEPVIGITI